MLFISHTYNQKELGINKKWYLLLAIFTLSTHLIGLSITINKGSVKKIPYSVLHIEHQKKFACISIKNAHKIITSFVCQLPNNIFTSNFKQNEYSFLTLKITKEKGNTYLNIYPKTKKSLMYPIDINIVNDRELKTDTTLQRFSKHWTFFFSNEETNLIFKKNKNIKGLDFGLHLNMPRPFIGTLDENKKPLVLKNQEEINTLLKIKDLYEQEDYKNTLIEISLFLQKEKNSVFKKEVLLYALRSYYKIGTEKLSQNTVDTALEWLNKYPSDKNIPEVLFYLGIAYSKLYKQIEAIEVFNELIKNYKINKFSFMAKLELGDNLRSSSNINESIKLYEDVLYHTQDVNIALLAASKIAEKSLDDGVLRKARHHYETIINKDIDFLIKDIEKAHRLATKLINSNFEDLGVKILDRILKKINQKLQPNRHSEILFETAEIYKKLNTNKAIEYYQEYIKLYPKSAYASAAKEELDKLVFKANDNKKLTDDEILLNIEYLIKTYPGQLIAKKAFYKKMKIFFKHNKYSEILAQKKQIEALNKEIAPDKEKFLNEAKMLYIVSLLNNKECGVFVQMVEKYKLEAPRNLDDHAYTCFYEQFRYKKARIVIDRQLTSGNDNDKTLWTYRLTQVLIKNLDYDNMTLAIEDLLDLIKVKKIKNKKYEETIYDLFSAYAHNKDEGMMIDLAKQIEQKFKDDIRNIKVFKAIVQLSIKKLDDKMTILYGKKIKRLSKTYDYYLESPWIDYSLYKAYLSMGNYKEALNTLNNLIKIKDKLKNLSISKVKYMQSDIYNKLKQHDKEKVYLQDCANIQNEKIWPNLCKEALKWAK